MVFCSVSTHLPFEAALFAASAAAAMSVSGRPASVHLSSTTMAAALVSASTCLRNSVVSFDSSLFERAQLVLVGLGELRAGADEVAVVALDEALLLGVELSVSRWS